MNRCITLVAVLTILLVETSHAQNLIWAKKTPVQTYGGIGLDPVGNKYIFSGENQSTYIYKFGIDTNVIWKKEIKDIWAGHVLYDWQGNIYYIGIAYKNLLSGAKVIDFNPDPPLDTVTIDQGFHFIAKYDTSGGFQWVKILRNVDLDLTFVSIDTQNNIYLSGGFSGTINLDPDFNAVSLTTSTYNGFVAKYDNTGKILWAKDGKNLSWAQADIYGNFYAIRGFSDSMDIAVGPAVNMIYGVKKNNICVSKYDQQFNLLWNRIWGSDYYMNAKGFNVDFGGNVYVCGDYQDSADFEPGPGITLMKETTPLSRAAFMVRFATNGNFEWAKSIHRLGPGTFMYSKLNPLSGELYVTGTFNYWVDFDPGPAVVTKIPESSISSYDYFLAKYNKNGDYQWVIHTTGGSFSDFIEEGNTIFCTGGSLDSTDLDPAPNTKNMAYLPTYNTPVGYIAKYSIPLSVETVSKGIKANVYPNPIIADEVIIDMGELQSTIRIQLSDITGKVIGTEQRSQVQKFAYRTSPLTPGVYLLQLSTHEGTTTVKLLKQ